jgi:deoxyribose-phosphate aldolase
MRSVVGNRAGVKASGGIRSLADASAMLHAGATRIGASASVKILAELGGVAPAPAVASGY